MANSHNPGTKLFTFQEHRNQQLHRQRRRGSPGKCQDTARCEPGALLGFFYDLYTNCYFSPPCYILFLSHEHRSCSSLTITPNKRLSSSFQPSKGSWSRRIARFCKSKPHSNVLNSLLTCSNHRPLTRYPGGPVDAPVKAAAKRLGGVPEEQILLAWAKAKGAVVLTYVLVINT